MERDSSRTLADNSSGPCEPGTRREVLRIQTPNTFAIVLLDIDHFGQYNDAYGHPAGNELLREIAGILQAVTRDTDVSARLERDVFAVLLPQTCAQGAVIAAERLRAAIAAYRGRQPVSVSIGVASSKATTTDEQQVLQEAEQALELAKRLGCNCVVHFDLTHSVVSQVVIPS
jgi:diguanylate cyclase (GGDEF)-like protein